MAKSYSKEQVELREFGNNLKRVVDLLERHITDCEKQHFQFNERIAALEKTSSYFDIYDKLKTVALVFSAAAIGWLLKTVLIPRG